MKYTKNLIALFMALLVPLTGLFSDARADAQTQKLSTTGQYLDSGVPAAGSVANPVQADYDWLTFNEIRNGNDDSSHVTRMLYLPDTGEYGSSIVWSTSDSSVITAGGGVIRPSLASKESVEVILTATLTDGTNKKQKTFVIDVLCENDSPDFDAVLWDCNMLYIPHNSGNDDNGFTNPVYLARSDDDSYFNTKKGCTVTWESSDTDIVDPSEGDDWVVLHRPSYLQGDTIVTLTAAISKGSVSLHKTFQIKALAVEVNADDLAHEDANWLDASKTLGADNLSQYAVTDDLTLPDTAGPNKSKITWESDTPSSINIVTDGSGKITGKVTRSDVSKTVKLTASLAHSQYNKVLEYTVLASPDKEPPKVTACSPENNSTGVLYDAKQITLTFSEKIHRKDESSSTCGITFQNSDVSHYSAAVKDNQLTVTLADNLTFGEEYTMTLPAGAVTDLSGNPMAADFKLTFHAEDRKTQNIAVTSTSPSDGEKNVSADSKTATVRFNRSDISQGRAFNSISLSTRGGDALDAAVTLSGDTVTLNLTNTSLQSGTVYQLQVPAGAVQDKYQNENTADTVLFLCGGEGAPQIFKIYPTNGQTSVDINQKIEVEFSKTVSLGSGKATLKDGGGNSVGTVAYVNGTNKNQVLIQPVSALKKNTKYTLNIPNNFIKDGSEQSMAQSTGISFTTGNSLLAVEKTLPAEEKDGTAVSACPEIDFSANVVRASDSLSIKMLDSNDNSVKFSEKISGNKVILMPDSTLSPSETYTVSVPSGLFQLTVPFTSLGLTSLPIPLPSAVEQYALNNALQFQFTTADAVSFKSADIAVSPSTTPFTDSEIQFGFSEIKNRIESAGYKVCYLQWSFGDGTVSKEQSPTHTYTAAGDYEATLNVTDSKGFESEFKKTISAQKFTYANVKMSVSPNYTKRVDVKDETSVQPYYVTLYYNDTPLPNASVSVQVYRDGVLVKDCGTVKTTSYHSYYKNDLGNWNSWYGTAAYYLRLSSEFSLDGNYEIRFTCGSGEDTKSVSVPVEITDELNRQTLRLKLYDMGNYKYIDYRKSVKLSLDGSTVTAQPKWYDSKDGYCLEIPNVTLGHHTVGSFDDDDYFFIVGDIYNNGYSGYGQLFVQHRQPGISQVVSDVSNSGSFSTTHFLKGVDRTAVQFTISGDWNRQNPGYYEVGAGGSTDNIRTILTTQQNQFSIKPQEILMPGEHMYCRMVTAAGIKTSWLDAHIRTIPVPDLGSGCNISYQNGQYQLSVPLSLASMTGGQGLLDDVPLLKNSTFGLGSSKYRLKGTMDDRRQSSAISLSFEDESSFSTEKSKKISKAKTVSTGFDFNSEIGICYTLIYYDSNNQWVGGDDDANYYWFDGDGSMSKSVGASVPKLNWPEIIKGKLTVGAKVTGLLHFNKSSGNILSIPNSYNGTLGFSPYVRGSISFDAKLASITGSVTGTLAAKAALTNSKLKSVTIEPSIKARIDAQYFTHTDNLYKKTLYDDTFVWNNSNSLLKSMSSKASASSLQLKTEDFQPMFRSYLNRKSVWNGSGGKKLLKATAMGSGNSPATIKTNINPLSDVCMLQNGDTPWMIWTDDNGSAVTNNCSQLMYSVKNGGTWSKPTEFDKDGTSDFEPAAASTGNGVLLAWQNISQSLTDGASITTMGKSSEISVTAKSLTGSNDGDPVTLTHDGQADYNPRLAADGNHALLVWQKTSNPNPQQESDDDVSLYYSCWNGDKNGWFDPVKLETPGHPVVDTSLAMQGNKGLLLYTLDMDNDLGTTDDQEIFARVYDGAAWDSAVRITKNEVEDSDPKAVSLNGKWFLLWNEDGSVVYKTGLNGDMKKDDALTGVGSNYKMAVADGKNSKLALVYTNPGENGTQSLSASFYDAGSGVWSGEIPLTEGDGGYDKSFSPAFTDDGKLMIAFTRADMVKEVVDGEEYPGPSNKVDLKLLTYSQVHDLALDADTGLQFSSDNPLPHTTDTVTATVKNQGDYIENATVSLYRGNPESNGIKVGEASTEQPIPARSSAQVNIDWVVGSDLGNSCDLYAVVKPAASVMDSELGNNTIHRAISSADLVLSDVTCINHSGNGYLLSAAVTNKGSKTLNQAVVRLTDDKSGKVLGSETLTEMVPGQTGGVNIMFSADGLTKNENGSISVTLTAVLPDGLTDNNPDDNKSQFDLEISPFEVESVNPGSGEAQITPQTPVTLTYNMNIDKSSGFDNIKLLDGTLNSVAITKTISGKTLTITPTGTMSRGTKYTLTIPQDALGDSCGHSMEAPHTLSFTTTTSSPEVTFSNPGTNMGKVATDSQIKMKYNQSILKGPALGNISITGSDSKVISASATVSGEWLILQPSGGLQKSVQYSVSVPRGAVKNADGEVQQETYSLNFQTENSLSNLQSLYDSCIKIKQGNYTDASWAAFIMALNNAKSTLDNSSATQDEINASITALTASKNGLTEKSSGHSNPSGRTESAKPSSEATFISDTTTDVRVKGLYTVKLTSKDGKIPMVVIGTPGIFETQLVSVNGSDYYVKLIPVGKPGEQAGVYVNGVKVFVAIVETQVSSVKSDTTKPFSLKFHSSYIFRLTADTKPIFVAGSTSVFKVEFVKAVGKDYFFKVTAVGKAGATSGFYINSEKAPVTFATVA